MRCYLDRNGELSVFIAMVESAQERRKSYLSRSGLTAISGVERLENPLVLAFDSTCKASGTDVARVQQSVASC
jgi:hypothetical protein